MRRTGSAGFVRGAARLCGMMWSEPRPGAGGNRRTDGLEPPRLEHSSVPGDGAHCGAVGASARPPVRKRSVARCTAAAAAGCRLCAQQPGGRLLPRCTARRPSQLSASKVTSLASAGRACMVSGPLCGDISWRRRKTENIAKLSPEAATIHAIEAVISTQKVTSWSINFAPRSLASPCS